MTSVTAQELRSLFLFESLPEDQLDWLAARAERCTFDDGATVFREGDPAEHLFVLLEGAVHVFSGSGPDEVVISETDHRGAYAGAIRSFVREADQLYVTTMTTRAPSSFLRLPADEFAAFLRQRHPMAVHLLDGIFTGLRTSEAGTRQREHLARLGSFSATLAHELNNPAAAAVRATEQLRDRVAGMRHKLALVVDARIDPAVLLRLVALQEGAVERAAKRTGVMTPLEEVDAEDALAERLEDAGVRDADALAPVFVGSGLDADWLDGALAELGDPGDLAVGDALRWVAYGVETEALMDEIAEATTRISALVAAVKQYSHPGASAVAPVDVRAGLDSTVVMLGHKLAGVTVRREHADDLPLVVGHAGELNQVWTNLIDNAVDAVGGTGVVVLRTRAEPGAVVVEVADDGPGIPADVQRRVFDAFVTTKAAGRGSGLGLDTARRIVERRHGGALSFTTGPGGTTFTVRLPLHPDPAPPPAEGP